MKVPPTSREAYESMKGEPISDHHNKIIAALSHMGNGIYEEIAKYIHDNMSSEFDDKNRVSRRLKELELKGLIEKDGTTRKTSSGRNAFCYRLVRREMFSDESKALLATPQHQISLFP